MPDKHSRRAHDRSSSDADTIHAARERELVMKVTKEIVVKFVEMGKVTPASFDEIFTMVHRTVSSSMRQSE